jgi:MFS family permease
MIDAPTRPVPLAELLWLGFYWFASSFHWGALITVLIPAEVLRFVPESQKGAFLGGLFSGGAVMAMVVSPISGALSDRSALPMGRRRPFVLAGALVNCLGLIGMRYAHTYLAYTGSYVVVQAANNFAGGAFNGLIPDKIPLAQRGLASGIMGFMMMIGTISGALISGSLVGQGHADAVYWIVAGVLAAGAGITAYGVRESPMPPPSSLSRGEFLRSFWIDPRRNRDFAWMFGTRALVMLGFYTLISFLQFFLKDTFHLTPPQAAQTTAKLSAVTIAAGAGVTLLAGWLSDRTGRKGIVSTAGIFLALTGAGLLFRPTLSSLLWIAVLFGIGYGAFTSVDWALAVDVLPSNGSPAKDLGIWAIANTGPQVLAPLAAGPVLDAFNRYSTNLGYSVVFAAAIVYVILGSILVWNIKGAR